MSKENVIKTIEQKLKKEKPLFSKKGTIVRNSTDNKQYMSINLSDIMTKLIQDTGRFCERYASDLIISYESMMGVVNNLDTNRKTHYEWFGLRQSGVDGIAYVLCNMNQNPASYCSQYYRKLYCVRVSAIKDNEITVDLLDMTNNIYSIANIVDDNDFTYEDYTKLM